MSKKIAFIFPGQGAQYPGMGHDFYQTKPAARAIFDRADEVLGRPFSQLIFDGPSEELTQTKNSQLAIFITSMAILEVVRLEIPDLFPDFCGGLSLGEYSALVAAGMLSFEEALLIVEARGKFMQEACETHPGTMYVVLGLDLNIVREAVDPIEGAWVANVNCPGQIVIAGTQEALDKCAPVLKEKGARRVMPLEVSGAFHSGLMQGAQDKLSPMIEKASLDEGKAEVVMNVPGDAVTDLGQMRKNLINQVTHPVLWQKDIETLCASGTEVFIEMGPGKTLAGMNKRIGVKVPTLSIEKAEDLADMKQKIEEMLYATHA